MIRLPEHLHLNSLLRRKSEFSVGVELVSTRGTMSQKQGLRARRLGEQLTHSERVDWVSITDNAGGNPQMAPVALGTPILYGGKEVVIHLTCKDLNRHALESQLWLLASQGFHNVLCMTGDYPMETFGGRARPVFDIDSVGLLEMLKRMNAGLEVRGKSDKSIRLGQTIFHAGAVVNNFKDSENTLVPQYLKLEKKIASGADFIINQIGFDSRRAHELIEYMRWRQLDHVPLVGNVYLLTGGAARLFNQNKIPGVALNDALHEICVRHAASPDKGKAFFRELAARQVAIYRGLGYAGAYLGGIHDFEDLEKILELEATFSPDDWKCFAKKIAFCEPNPFHLFAPDPESGLCHPGTPDPTWQNSLKNPTRARASSLYQISKAFHTLLFEQERWPARAAAKICGSAKDPRQGPAWMRAIERVSKSVLYNCRDCGDCSLAETAFLCPESQCAKNQRNGPCGGTRNGKCEVYDYDCIWARAYDRMKSDGKSAALLDHAPVVQDQGLRNTSAWANFWLGRDHTAKTETLNNQANTTQAK